MPALDRPDVLSGQLPRVSCASVSAASTMQGERDDLHRMTETAGPAQADALVRALADLAQELHHQRSVQAVAERVVGALVDVVPGATDAFITVVGKRAEPRTTAATSAFARRVPELQDDVGHHLSVDAPTPQRSGRSVDIVAETLASRPLLDVRAQGQVAGSVLCVELHLAAGHVASVTLLAEAPHAFDEEAQRIAELVCAHAAVALSGARTLERLCSALDRRNVIGVAKGILMERLKITADQAFALLVTSSQTSNRRLHDVAGELADTGQLPDRAAPAEQTPPFPTHPSTTSSPTAGERRGWADDA